MVKVAVVPSMAEVLFGCVVIAGLSNAAMTVSVTILLYTYPALLETLHLY